MDSIRKSGSGRTSSQRGRAKVGSTANRKDDVVLVIGDDDDDDAKGCNTKSGRRNEKSRKKKSNQNNSNNINSNWSKGCVPSDRALSLQAHDDNLQAHEAEISTMTEAELVDRLDYYKRCRAPVLAPGRAEE